MAWLKLCAMQDLAKAVLSDTSKSIFDRIQIKIRA